MISIGDTFKRYYTPGQLCTDNVISFYSYSLGAGGLSQKEESLGMDGLCQRLKTSPLVISITKSVQFLPYMRDLDNYLSDSILVEHRRMKVYIKGADENTQKVFRPKLESGVWLTDKALVDGSYPVVITRQLMEDNGWNEAVGRQIICFGFNCTIVGVVAGFKHKPMSVSYPTVIVPLCLCPNWLEYSVLVKSGEILNFRSYLYKEFCKFFDKERIGLGVTELDKLKSVYLQHELLALVAIAIPTLFILFFTFIGTFGLFWLYSSHRKKEFALRIVVGSTPAGLMKFVIAESLLLTVLAWIPGLLLFFITNPLTVTNLLALGGTCFVMLLFSVFSAWWPARQVSRVKPIEAMRRE